MSLYSDVAERLETSLKLALPPVSVCITNEVPEDIQRFSGKAPAGCLFWQEAAKGPFFTSTEDHELCAIGVHTHHMADPSLSYASELGQVLKVMAELDYVCEEDVTQIPVVTEASKHVLYSPLADTPLPPDVVLLFAHSQQGLVITEAVQQIQSDIPPAMGRPACAVIPQVINSGRVALSLGCCGARAYLDALSDDIALWAIPGNQIEVYAERIEALAGANETLSAFHQLRRKDVESGLTPTIEESLSRLAG